MRTAITTRRAIRDENCDHDFCDHDEACDHDESCDTTRPWDMRHLMRRSSLCVQHGVRRVVPIVPTPKPRWHAVPCQLRAPQSCRPPADFVARRRRHSAVAVPTPRTQRGAHGRSDAGPTPGPTATWPTPTPSPTLDAAALAVTDAAPTSSPTPSRHLPHPEPNGATDARPLVDADIGCVSLRHCAPACARTRDDLILIPLSTPRARPSSPMHPFPLLLVALAARASCSRRRVGLAWADAERRARSITSAASASRTPRCQRPTPVVRRDDARRYRWRTSTPPIEASRWNCWSSFEEMSNETASTVSTVAHGRTCA